MEGRWQKFVLITKNKSLRGCERKCISIHTATSCLESDDFLLLFEIVIEHDSHGGERNDCSSYGEGRSGGSTPM